MNLIDTSQISDPSVEQPFTGPSLAFLQAATLEMDNAILQSLIGDVAVSALTPYILFGCVQESLGGGNYSYTAGYIYFNGEILAFPAIASISIAQHPVCSVLSSSVAGPDPATFSDGSTKNVHLHYYVNLLDGPLATYAFDYVNCIRVNAFPSGAWSERVILQADLSINAGSTITIGSNSKMRYLIKGKKMEFVINVNFSTGSGDWSGVVVDLHDIFEMTSNIVNWTQAGFDLTSSPLYKLWVYGNGTAQQAGQFNISPASGVIAANTFNFSWSGVIEIR